MIERSTAAVLGVQAALRKNVRGAALRAEKFVLLVDHSLAQPILTARQVQRRLDVTHGRPTAWSVSSSSPGCCGKYGNEVYARRFPALNVLAMLLRSV